MYIVHVIERLNTTFLFVSALLQPLVARLTITFFSSVYYDVQADEFDLPKKKKRSRNSKTKSSNHNEGGLIIHKTFFFDEKI